MKKVVLFLCVLLCTYIAFTEENPQLAVVRFSSGDTARAQEIATTVRNLVESKLVASGEYDVIAREEIDLLLENQQIQLSSISSQENLKKLQLQNISYIVTGTIDILDDSCIVTIRLLEVDSGKFTNSTNGIMKNDVASLFQGTTTLTDNLIAGQTVSGGAIAQTQNQEKLYLAPYNIGDIGPGGGLIFYIDGNNYLEASQVIGEAPWLEAQAGARNYRGGGYSDWYLPSKVELELVKKGLYYNGYLGNIGWLWTSSDFSATEAYHDCFHHSKGGPDTGDKRYSTGFLAVRGFSALQEVPSKSYNIGDSSPSGGIVFFKSANTYYELSQFLGKGTWDEANIIARNYRGGGNNNWRLPTREELSLVYYNLIEKKLMLNDFGFVWTSDDISTHESILHMYDGEQSPSNKNIPWDIYAVRTFISAPQVQTSTQNANVVLATPTMPAQTQQVKKTYRLGEVGPGGGLIFHLTGNTYYECSPILGSGTWEEAVIIANNYTGGGHNDWGLPTNDELLLLYSNLREKNFIRDIGIIWGAEDHKDLGNAIDFSFSRKQIKLYYKLDVLDIRAVRAFNVE